MIISLVTLLIMHFSNGPGEIFLVPDVDKKIKKIIVEKERKKEALALFRTTKKRISKYNKALNKKNKPLKKEKYRASLSDSDIEQFFQESFEERKRIQGNLIEQRLKIREVMSEEEWNKFIEMSLQEIIDKDKKIQKAEDKRDKADEKLLSKIRSSLQKAIADPDHKEKALADFADFEKIVINLFDEDNALTLENNPTVQSYNVTREELQNIYGKLNNARNQLYSSFFVMKDTMTGYLTDDEWNAVTKAFIPLL